MMFKLPNLKLQDWSIR